MSEQQLSAAGKAPRPGLLWHQCLLVLVEVYTNSSLGALKAVFYLIGAVPDRVDPTPLSLLSWRCLVIPWLQDGVVRVLSLEAFVFLLLSLV